MAKAKRHLVAFEVSKEEEALLDQRAKQEGVNRSQYLRECFILEFFMSGDLECYKYLGRKAGAAVKGVLADKVKHFDRGLLEGQTA